MHVEVVIFLIAWTLTMVYVVVGNYLYFTKILPALSRDGLDGWPKFMPSKQLAQVDLFLSRFPSSAPRPWYHGVLARVRTICAAVAIAQLVAFGALVAKFWSL